MSNIGLPVPTFSNIEYDRVDDISLLLDLYLPERAEAPVPAVVWVHGGGWNSGDKVDDFLPLHLANSDFALVSINYRLSGEAIFPANVEDCKTAVRWLRANAGKYNLDPDRFGLVGASAGGHLVALLGLTGDVSELNGNRAYPDHSSAVQAVCDFCGPTDLRRMGIHEHKDQSPVLYELTSEYLGGPVEERMELAWQASPLRYVKGKCPPFLIIHGEADDIVPVEEAHLLHDTMVKEGHDLKLIIREGIGHDCMEGLEREVQAFFAKTLI